MQIDGSNDEVMRLGDPVLKYQAFGWNACLVKGNDVMAIQRAVRRAVEEPNGKPSMIVLDTVKGEGARCVMEMANNHCIGFSDELCGKVMEELREQGRKLGMEVE